MLLTCKECPDWDKETDSDGEKHRLGEEYGTCRCFTSKMEGKTGQFRPRKTTHQDDFCLFGRIIQEDLDPQAKKVLYENLWDLYS